MQYEPLKVPYYCIFGGWLSTKAEVVIQNVSKKVTSILGKECFELFAVHRYFGFAIVELWIGEVAVESQIQFPVMMCEAK